RRAGRPRRHGGRPHRQPDRRRRRSGRLVRLRHRLEGDLLLPALHPGPRVPPRRALRPARIGNARRLMTGLTRHAGALVLFGGAAVVPLVIRDAFFLDSLVLLLLWGALSAARTLAV